MTSSFSQRRPPRDYLITYTDVEGLNASSLGLSFYSYPDNNNRTKWMFPMVISVNVLTLRPSYFEKLNYESAKLNYYMPGISAFRKINNYFWLNLGLQIPIGSEEVKDYYGNKFDTFLIGLVPTEGIFFIPQSDVGFTFSVGLYQELMTSIVYNVDIGLKAEIGIKF